MYLHQLKTNYLHIQSLTCRCRSSTRARVVELNSSISASLTTWRLHYFTRSRQCSSAWRRHDCAFIARQSRTAPTTTGAGEYCRNFPRAARRSPMRRQPLARSAVHPSFSRSSSRWSGIGRSEYQNDIIACASSKLCLVCPFQYFQLPFLSPGCWQISINEAISHRIWIPADYFTMPLIYLAPSTQTCRLAGILKLVHQSMK